MGPATRPLTTRAELLPRRPGAGPTILIRNRSKAPPSRRLRSFVSVLQPFPVPLPLPTSPMAEIPATLVKTLREKTAAGMMDCKNALKETNGDIDKAIELLRQKGMASAEKKAGRTAAEGSIGSYIHTGARIGVLVEVNCETDFVARGEIFQELLRNVAMQIAACPSVEYVNVEDIPAAVANREKQIEMGRDDLAGKKEEMKEKIVAGRISKRLKELALMDQPFIKENTITVSELVKQVAGKLGENIRVRRFVRFNLGEGIEVNKLDFAAEVAAMGGA